MASPRGLTGFLCLMLFNSVLISGAERELLQLEEQVRNYLNQRVLVFRDPTRGRELLGKDFLSQGSKQPADERFKPALLFLNLHISQERLVLSGEPVRLQCSRGKRLYSKDSERLRIVRVSLVLPVPVEKLSFGQVVAILAEAFLTREELEERTTKRQRDSASPVPF